MTNPFALEGTIREDGARLIFNRWADQAGMRVLIWILAHGGIELQTVDVGTGAVVHTVSLVRYRVGDLRDALEANK